MKPCFIVNYWADTDEKVEMVVNCIKQLKKTGRDIIYTSLCPIDKRISDETNFSIFSNSNELITLADLLDTNINLTNNVSYNSVTFRFFSIPLNWKGVSYSMSKPLLANIKMLKSLDYTHVHYINGDNIITDNELEIFNIIEKTCSLLNKKAYFEDISEKFSKAYSGLYFYSDVDFFILNFTTPQTKKDHIEQYTIDDGILCFEQILYYHFQNQEKYLLLGNNDSWGFGPLILFKNSEIDIVKSYNNDDNYHIIPLELTQGIIEADYVFVVSKETNHFKICVDDDFEEGIVKGNEFIYLKTNKKQFNLKILKNGVVDFEETITEERLK